MKKSVPRYTEAELDALHEIYEQLFRDHILNRTPGGAHWQRTQGLVADLLAGALPRR